MTDDDLLRGLDAERPLPPSLRERLERALTTRAWTDAPDENPLEGIDEPRRVPEPARERIEHAMHASAPDVLHELDAPHEMPAPVRARLEDALIADRAGLAAPARRRAFAMRALAVAASVMLIAASSVAVFRSGAKAVRPPVAAPSQVPTSSPGVPVPALGLPVAPRSVAIDTTGTVPSFGSPSAPGDDRGPAPPFAYAAPLPPNVAPLPPPAGHVGIGPIPSGEIPTFGPLPPAPPLRVGIVRGDAAQEAAFRAYVDLLNRRGGVRRHRIELVDVSRDEPGSNTVATVNLSARPIATGEDAPAWARGPVLETLSASGDVLHGSAWSVASPVERQAHLIADRMYPEPVQGPTTALIYHAGGAPFDDAIPTAIEEVLRARGVTSIRVAYQTDGAANVFVPADVVFLSLDADTAAAWFDQARAVAYRPSRGVAGVYSLFDARLRAALEEFGARVLSPYLVPLNAETRSKAFRSIDEPLGMGVIHGWVTAKDLAVAIWLHDVDGPRSMRAALRALEGYASGFAPPLDWRVGTHARTPEGLVYEVDDGLFTPMTGFLRDPF